MKRKIVYLASILAAVACLQPDPDPRFTPAWEAFNPVEDTWQTTRKVLLVSDPQIHNLYSKAVPDRNLSIEAAAATAIRPPQLDLFAPDVLGWILENGAPDSDVTIMTGDALDIACEGEFDTFMRVMETSDKPWFLAPGNHDFFYFGSYDPQDRGMWEDACHGAGRPMTKDLFIRFYVAAMIRQDDPGCIALAEALGLADRRESMPVTLEPDIPSSFDWIAPPSTGGFLEAISWSIDAEELWRSYILQSIDLTGPTSQEFPVHALLLDSCQYGRRPLLLPNAWMSFPLGLNCGLTGEMLPDQLRKVREWLELDPNQEHSFMFMSHHPFDEYAPRARASLGWLWRERRVSMFVTGHTHQGYYEHHTLNENTEELELNLGSTTDWPMEWRTLEGYVNPELEELYIQADRFTLADVLRHREGFFQLGWEIPQDAPDDYRKYKQGEEASALLVDFALAHHIVPYWLPQPIITANAAARETEEAVKDTLLWTYFRLVQYFPTDVSVGETAWPGGTRTDRQVTDKILAMTGETDALLTKVALLQELAAFESSRKTKNLETGLSMDEDRLHYKLSQAAWASRYESAQGRRLSVEDDLIRIDWERAMQRRQELIGR